MIPTHYVSSYGSWPNLLSSSPANMNVPSFVMRWWEEAWMQAVLATCLIDISYHWLMEWLTVFIMVEQISYHVWSFWIHEFIYSPRSTFTISSEIFQSQVSKVREGREVAWGWRGIKCGDSLFRLISSTVLFAVFIVYIAYIMYCIRYSLYNTKWADKSFTLKLRGLVLSEQSTLYVFVSLLCVCFSYSSALIILFVFGCQLTLIVVLYFSKSPILWFPAIVAVF